MRRTKEPEGEGWTNTSAKVHRRRWTELRKLALDQNRTATEVLDDAIKLYLKQQHNGPEG